MRKYVLIIMSLLVMAISVFADSSTYLNFTAVNGPATVYLRLVDISQYSPSSISLQYSIDNCSTWNAYNIGYTINLTSGSKVYFKATSTNNTFSGDIYHYKFGMTGTVSADGNIMSLLDASMTQDSVPYHAFDKLFENCTSLIQAPSLPATTLAERCYFQMFYGCTSLTTAPTLPATTLADYCYSQMFYGCTSLVTAPALPATTLADFCYNYMFYGCTSLTTAPALPATTLSAACYAYMFKDCTSLTTAPTLPANTLSRGCYELMFDGCTSLTTAPALPATTLAEKCYSGMFEFCTSLTTAPALPATTLAEECYSGMFEFCTSLTTAPALPATTLADYCYYLMFYSCTSLVTAPALPATTLADYCYREMFLGCTSLILNFTAPGTPWIIPATSTVNNALTDMFLNTSGTMNGTPSVNTTYYLGSDPAILVAHPLCFTARNGIITVSFDIYNISHTIQYSTDSINWFTYTSNTNLTINENESIYFRSETNQTAAEAFGGKHSYNSSSHFNFTSINNGTVECSGNIMSLYGPNCSYLPLKEGAFSKMFEGCTLLTSAPVLPATTLAEYCYEGMFNGCTSLRTPPALPATTLSNNCYEGMFEGCTLLATATTLPATSLMDYCYSQMFSGCTSLVTPPALPATTLANHCYSEMFRGCTSLSTLPTLSATTLVDYCYYQMFDSCTSLILNFTAPGTPWIIPVTSTVNNALTDMFLNTGGTMNSTPSVNYTYYLVEPAVYTVTVNVNDVKMGSVTGGGQYIDKSTATLTATPNEGYVFSGWDNGETNRVIYVTVTSDMVITAIFEPEQTGVENVNDAVVITLAPNPIKLGETAYLYMNLTGDVMIDVLNESGQCVKSMKANGTSVAIDGLNLAGTYFVRITTSTGKVYVRKLIVN